VLGSTLYGQWKLQKGAKGRLLLSREEPMTLLLGAQEEVNREKQKKSKKANRRVTGR